MENFLADENNDLVNEIKEVAAGGLIYGKKSKKFLIIKKRKNQQWGFPKGRKDSGDGGDLVLTAKREIKEETNLDVEIVSTINASCTYEMDKKGKKFLMIFLAEVEIEDVKFTDQEIEQSEWLIPSDFIERLSTLEMKALADRLFSQISERYVL